ncbi:family 20 glycosylhydrolase [Parahaliea maris]|uniref:beta-N-acetylhexosaminidase n=1 Tax=Parahaliea maris TaxID=2716870 RepID=A0A5C8ZNM0_9GAMM|nr:family 20 glycosylhydrolase [Parahaliea maris]TXS89815.1 family 20 glycosylhydrolase [Parahaliea maris]
MLLPVIPQPVIPQPRHSRAGSGQFLLLPATPLIVGEPVLDGVGERVRSALGLRSAEGYEGHEGYEGYEGHEGHETGSPALTLELDASLPGPEHYELEIRPDGLRLAGGAEAGVMFALQTLLQLVPVEVDIRGLPATGVTLPSVTFRDGPACEWRGMHLDCSRHFFPVAFIKRYLDLLALHKMNRFHWHLTDDQGWRLESSRFPALTGRGAWRSRTVEGHTSNREKRYREQAYGGFYSQQDIRDIVSYARERQIEVVPEIDIPGHAAALLAAHPELACAPGNYEVEAHFGIFPDVLCPKEETFTFLGELFSEVAGLFPGDCVHIGGDEVVKAAWRHCPHCQQLIADKQLGDEDGLHGYFVARVAHMLKGLGKKVIGWDEVMDGDVPRDTTVMCWNASAGVRALEAGYPTVLTPVDRVYFDFYQSTSLDEPAAIHGLTPLRKVYEFDPFGLAAGASAPILGGQGNVWTEYLATPAAVEYALLPRLSALAEVLWTGESRNWGDFCRRLPTLVDRLRLRGYTVADSACKPAAVVSSVRDGVLRVGLCCDFPDVAIHYTTDGSPPGPDSVGYNGELAVSGEWVLRAVGIDANGTVHGDERLHLAAHRALHRQVYHWREDGLQRAPELALLTNGCRNNERIFQYHEWVEFAGTGADIVVDLEQVTSLQRLRCNVEAGAHRQLARPAGVRLLGSSDGQRWQPLAALDEADIAADGALDIPLAGHSARYLRLQLDNSLQYYSPETRQLQRFPLYLDELVVD